MSKLRVLLVEDNLLNRQLARDILEYRGHEVVVAASVEEARFQLRLSTPDIVLLDIQIPGDGETLAKEIRANPALKGLPVIAVTAYAMEGDRDRLLSVGFDAYIAKPIDTKHFGPTVESFIKTGEQSNG